MRIRVLDVETTGVTPTDHVVEIGAWDYIHDDKGGDVACCDERFVKPPIPIPPEMSAIHHITDEDVARAPSWAEVSALFIDHDVDAYCAHHAVFERQWLTDKITRDKPWIDTLRCAYRLWPDAPSHSNQALRYWLKLDVDRSIASPSHRAGPDAYVTACLLKVIFQQLKVTFQGLVDVSKMAGLSPRIRFGKHAGKKWSEIEIGYLDWMVKQDEMDEEATAAAWREIRRRRPAKQKELALNEKA